MQVSVSDLQIQAGRNQRQGHEYLFGGRLAGKGQHGADALQEGHHLVHLRGTGSRADAYD